MTTNEHLQTDARQSFWTTVGIIAKREITVRLLSKSFIISTVVTLVIVLAVMVFMPQMEKLMSGGDDMVVAATTETAPTLHQFPDFEIKEVADDAAAREAVKSEDVDAAVIASAEHPSGMTVLALRKVPSDLMQALSVSPRLELVDPDAPNPMVSYFIALGFGMVWLMSAITFGMSIANSVVEEKQTRIVEILLASVSSKALLTGKILGNSLAALVQILLLAGTVLVGMAINGDSFPTMNLTEPIIWFVVLFLIGFVMVAALYAAAAALVSQTEDLANVQQPIMWLVMLPYFGVIFLVDNPLAMQIMSYIPFSAPVAVPVRIFNDELAFWEPYVAGVILVITTVLITMLAARIYKNGLLRTGKPLKWREGLMAAD